MESSCSVIQKPCNAAVNNTEGEPPEAKIRAPCSPHSGHTAGVAKSPRPPPAPTHASRWQRGTWDTWGVSTPEKLFPR